MCYSRLILTNIMRFLSYAQHDCYDIFTTLLAATSVELTFASLSQLMNMNVASGVIDSKNRITKSCTLRVIH